jgi:DNA polymerase-3 subunit delta'
MRARDGRRKVAIISEADRMMAQAANAFLKTLEEPPNNSPLLLLSAIPEVLPDTIRSRCLAIPLAPPTDATLSEEENSLLELLNGLDPTAPGGVHEAYQLAQGFQRLLRQSGSHPGRDDEVQKREETRYRNTTGGAGRKSKNITRP